MACQWLQWRDGGSLSVTLSTMCGVHKIVRSESINDLLMELLFEMVALLPYWMK